MIKLTVELPAVGAEIVAYPNDVLGLEVIKLTLELPVVGAKIVAYPNDVLGPEVITSGPRTSLG